MTKRGRGAEARALNENKLLADIFDEIETTATKIWKSSDNVEKREAAWHQVRAVEFVRSSLKNIIREEIKDENQH